MHSQGCLNGDSLNHDDESAWRDIAQLVSDFNRHSLKVAMQSHRQTRFKQQELFEAHKESDRAPDVWDFIHINSDVVAFLVVGGKAIWRVGNVEGIRLLQKEPDANSHLDKWETHSFPSKVQVNEQRAAFLVRWYRECSPDGELLDGFLNDDHASLSTAKKCLKSCRGNFLRYMLSRASSRPHIPSSYALRHRSSQRTGSRDPGVCRHG